MPNALTPLLALAALVLCLAGAAKLRSPVDAAQALESLGVRVPAASIRAFALFELALGGLCLARPSAVPDFGLAALYIGFCAMALVLARRRSPCGCFGRRQEPASAVQSALSAGLGAAAAGAAVAGAHGAAWLVGRPAMTAGVLVIGLVGAAYGTVVAYTELPLAWSAWSGRSR